VYPRNLPGLALLIAVFAPHTGSAGPPFRTDGPVPVEPQHWEIYLFSTGTHAVGGTAGILPGIDANYGAAPDLQLHAAVPYAFGHPHRRRVGNSMLHVLAQTNNPA
jgi:hypothetical protein